MSEQNNENFKKDRLVTLAIGTMAIILVFGSMSLINFYLNKKFPPENKPPEVIIQEPKTKPSEFPDYEAYKSLDRKINLLKETHSFITKDYKKIGETNKTFYIKGKFKRAYLFIDVSVDKGKPLTVYDSIYLILNYKGGHILRNKTLPVPPSDTTQLLYDMREVPYINSVPYSENKTPLFADWFALLNSKENIFLYTFLSSYRDGGMIEEITIAYECEKNYECSIFSK